MEIKSLNNSEKNIQQVQQRSEINIQNKQAEKLQSKVQEIHQSSTKQDSLQISQEGKKLQEIQNKLNAGFYNQPEVIKSTAGFINQAYPKSKTGN